MSLRPRRAARAAAGSPRGCAADPRPAARAARAGPSRQRPRPPSTATPAAARQLLDGRLLEAAGLVAADGVVDLQRPVAVERGDRRRVLAGDDAARDLGRPGDLRVALPVAEVVAVHPALVAVVARAVAAAGEVLAGLAVAVDVVAHVLFRAEALAAVRRVLPPAGRVGVRWARVAAVVDLAAERGVAVGAQAVRAVARADDAPRRGGLEQVAERPDGERRPDQRRAREQPAPRRAPLERRARSLDQALGHRAGPLLYDCHARGNTVKATKDA